MRSCVSIFLSTLFCILLGNAAGQTEDLARYTPLWIRDGFATDGLYSLRQLRSQSSTRFLRQSGNCESLSQLFAE